MLWVLKHAWPPLCFMIPSYHLWPSKSRNLQVADGKSALVDAREKCGKHPGIPSASDTGNETQYINGIDLMEHKKH